MHWIEVWLSKSNAISEAKPWDISLHGIAMHLIVCNKHCKSLALILIDVMGQVPQHMIKQFARSMSWFLSCHVAKDLPLGDNYRNSKSGYAQILCNVQRPHATLMHTNNDSPLLHGECPRPHCRSCSAKHETRKSINV